MASLKKSAGRTGRPRVPAGDQRTVPVKLLVTPSEATELTEAAERDAMSLSTWGRVALLRQARASKK